MRNYLQLVYKILDLAAPVVFNRKPAALIRFHNGEPNSLQLWKEYKSKFYGLQVILGLRFIELNDKPTGTLVLFYNPKKLKAVLTGEDVAGFLRQRGYPEHPNLRESLATLKERFTRECPPEVGVFLGIPVDDVRGFIDQRGKNYLFNKYWKVYHQPAKARRLFEGFDSSRRNMKNLLDELFLN